MKTENHTSNIMSRSGYEKIIEMRNEREARQQEAEEKLRREAMEEKAEASKQHIKDICDDVEKNYTAMINDGRAMQNSQDKLNELLEVEKLFLETADERYPKDEVVEMSQHAMKLHRIAYYVLPAMDCFFAYFAIYPIITSKFAHLSPQMAGVAEIVGIVMSIVVGLGLSLLSRFAVASMRGDVSPFKKVFMSLALVLSMTALPLMYVVGEVTFSGGKSWAYSGVFACISFVIQLLIVTGYKSQEKAINRLKETKGRVSGHASREDDESIIREEIREMNEEMDGIMEKFDRDYDAFTRSFRSLALARDEHISEFGEDVKLYLNQLVIYFGDLVCFYGEVIPLRRCEDGSIMPFSFLSFQKVNGGQDLFTSDDFIILDYMLRRRNNGISLTETIRLIEEHNRLEPSNSLENRPTAPELTERQAGTLDSVDNSPAFVDEPVLDDDDTDNHGIW